MPHINEIVDYILNLESLPDTYNNYRDVGEHKVIFAPGIYYNKGLTYPRCSVYIKAKSDFIDTILFGKEKIFTVLHNLEFPPIIPIALREEDSFAEYPLKTIYQNCVLPDYIKEVTKETIVYKNCAFVQGYDPL